MDFSIYTSLISRRSTLIKWHPLISEFSGEGDY